MTSVTQVLTYLNALELFFCLEALHVGFLKLSQEVLKNIVKPILNKTPKKKHVAWAHKYINKNYQHVLFTDETRGSLDVPMDGWYKACATLEV